MDDKEDRQSLTEDSYPIGISFLPTLCTAAQTWYEQSGLGDDSLHRRPSTGTSLCAQLKKAKDNDNWVWPVRPQETNGRTECKHCSVCFVLFTFPHSSIYRVFEDAKTPFRRNQNSQLIKERQFVCRLPSGSLWLLLNGAGKGFCCLIADWFLQCTVAYMSECVHTDCRKPAYPCSLQQGGD